MNRNGKKLPPQPSHGIAIAPIQKIVVVMVNGSSVFHQERGISIPVNVKKFEKAVGDDSTLTAKRVCKDACNRDRKQPSKREYRRNENVKKGNERETKLIKND